MSVGTFAKSRTKLNNSSGYARIEKAEVVSGKSMEK